MSLDKVAFGSMFSYPPLQDGLVAYNLTQAAYPSGIVIGTGYGYIPYFRVWAEMVPGEVSPVWQSGAVYIFSQNYEDAAIYGVAVSATETDITIAPLWDTGMTSCRVYLRIYDRTLI